MAPSLVDLTLEQSVPRLPSHTTQPPPARGPSVALPSLQTLRILCDTNDCVRFMDHLSINPAATMEITGNLGTDSGIKRLLEIVSAHASRSTALLASRISLPHPHTRSAISIRGYRDVDVRRLDLDELGDIDVTFDNLQPGDRPFAAALRGAGAIFSGVQYLSLVSENGSNVSWPSLFECVPSVETLEILGHPGPGFAEALFHLRDVQNGESSATSGPLLRLRELKLDDVYFRRWDGASWSHGGEFFDKLLDWTILRCNHGIPLERLQVWQCRYATVKDIHRLREIVVEVDWDMWEQESDEDEDEDDDDDFYAHHHPMYGWY
uniref:Cytochrome P450 monooxygenase CYP52X1 n=1 Tax=Ganoderma boninense TaxID=34458 RepID=A0A5K1JVZ7_9APHY|nr:Cytochrome P450 monooxygenase CYP52X1 [Ganoderma boninense]